MATLRTRLGRLAMGQVVALLIACFVAGCGSGGGPGIPTPGPTRVPAPTVTPGGPTPIPPHFPPTATPTGSPTPAIMNFTFRDACSAAQTIRLRLFDETKDLIYLDGMSDYIITATPRPISIACALGDQMCYGGQDAKATPTPGPIPNRTPITLKMWGVGLNNDRSCTDCCFTCASKTIPQIDLRCP